MNIQLPAVPCCRKSETGYKTRHISPQFILVLQLRCNTNANFHYGHVNYINGRVFWFVVTAVCMQDPVHFWGSCQPYCNQSGQRIWPTSRYTSLMEIRNQHHLVLHIVHLCASHRRGTMKTEVFGNDLNYLLMCDKKGRAYFMLNIIPVTGASGSVICWGTMPQAGRSRVLFPMRLLDSSTDLILSVAQRIWVRFSLLTEMNIRNLPGGKGRPARKTDNREPIV
jgi:hypothetical protein